MQNSAITPDQPIVPEQQAESAAKPAANKSPQSLRIRTKDITLPPIPEGLNPVPVTERQSRKKPKYYRETIVISDQAVLQYLGKRMGFDPEDIKARLLTPTIKAAINTDAKSVKSLGYNWRIVNGRIVGLG